MRKSSVYLITFIGLVVIFFFPFFLYGKLPIPSDTIIGIYHPFRDFYHAEYARGFPFKNFLITDPVRQLYPWKYLSIDILKTGQLPLWNPYQLSGTPLLANFQSGSFYPLNLIYVFLPFDLGWSIFVILQPLLGGIFLYFYLKNLKLISSACLFGAIVFSFCGFSISWLEWNSVIQTVIWLPLILLAKDKLILKWTPKWIALLFFAEVSSIFAGHLQTLFYALCISNVYLFAKILQHSYKMKGKNVIIAMVRSYIPFLLMGIVLCIVTAIQWYPTLQFINLSARSVDQADFMKEGWFIPWQNLVQFIVPDFFGNPSTLNYWGVWNYGEFIGYIGIIPFVTAIFAMLFRRDRKTFFYSLLLIIGLIFAFPNPLSILPYSLHIPFISTSQPTRLIFVIDFALAVLAALGFDYIEKKKKEYFVSFGLIGILLAIVWFYIQIFSKSTFSVSPENISIAKHNLILPTILFMAGAILSVGLLFTKKNRSLMTCITCLLLLISAFDLIRFGQKYEAFVSRGYLFPVSKSIAYIKAQNGIFRIASNDSRIFPPNFSTYYKIQSIEGYDPLYLLSYGELIAAIERNEPNINPPFGFNRIITPHNINSRFMDLLNVKYIFSLTDLNNPKYKKVFQEGETRVYENLDVMPRAFFVNSVYVIPDKSNQIKELFNTDFHKNAIISSTLNYKNTNLSIGTVQIEKYSPNAITLRTQNSANGFLVLTDAYYPTWGVYIDGKKDTIYKADYAFRGVFVPKGEHIITFKINLL